MNRRINGWLQTLLSLTVCLLCFVMQLSPALAQGDSEAQDPSWWPWIVPFGIIITIFLLGTATWYRQRSRRAKDKSLSIVPDDESTAQKSSLPEEADPITSTHAYLLLKDDPSRQFLIEEIPFSIGRAEENNLIIDENFPQWESVSRYHAQIVLQPLSEQMMYVIEDLGSQNGVRVNERPTPQNLLRDGWTVAIGGIEFTFTTS